MKSSRSTVKISMNSPLLFPVRLEDNKIIVLDETKNPFTEEYIDVDTLDKALWVLGAMKTRSLGQVFLFFYSCVLFSQDSDFKDLAIKFKKVRPTFDFLMLAQILNMQVAKGLAVKDAVDRFIKGFDIARKKRAGELAQLLPKNSSIITICNVNGELIYLYDELKTWDKNCIFYVCETRPYLQGSRLTFWELRENNIPCRLICDSQAAVLMQNDMINCVVVGADRATVKGDIINKIGTYALARLAKHFDIPFYALTQYPRDIDIDSVEIEERDPKEALMYLSDEDCSDMPAIYPAFDITPADFVTRPMVLKV